MMTSGTLRAWFNNSLNRTWMMKKAIVSVVLGSVAFASMAQGSAPAPAGGGATSGTAAGAGAGGATTAAAATTTAGITAAAGAAVVGGVAIVGAAVALNNSGSSGTTGTR